jgi:hypothetical protein
MAQAVIRRPLTREARVRAHFKTCGICGRTKWHWDRFLSYTSVLRRSQWPHDLTRGSAVARLLGLRVRMPPGSWMSVCCECCVLSGRGLCDELVPRPEESYRVWCVFECNREVSKMWRPRRTRGCRAMKRRKTKTSVLLGQ